MSDEVLLIDDGQGSMPTDPSILSKIPDMYVAVLDHLLTLPHVKAKLVETESLEKKWQLVHMYNHVVRDDQRNQTSKLQWDQGGNQLLESIKKSRSPNIQWFSKLKLMLSTSNKDFMSSFINSGGVAVLMQSINNRLLRPTLSDFDVALLYEILLCCKVSMNNSVGMDGFLSVQRSVETIARCIRFEHKLFTLQVLELLSVCCYYSIESAKLVYKGIKVAAKSHQEGAFAAFSIAMIEGDVEIKANIMKFINSLLTALQSELPIFEQLKIDLNKQLFGERYAEAGQLVDKELLGLNTLNPQETMIVSRLSMTVYDKVPFEDPYSMYTGTKKGGYLAVDESFSARESIDSPRDTMSSSPRRSSLTSPGVSGRFNSEADETSTALASFPHSFEVRVLDKTLVVSPACGTMAGVLLTSKASKFTNNFTGWKKYRYFELNGNEFKNLQQKKDKPNIPVSSIVDIRAFTTNSAIANATEFAFEVETSSKTFVFGCEDQMNRDKWVAALNTAREIYVINSSTYKTQLDAIMELSPSEVLNFAEMFKKQGALFNSIVLEKEVVTVSAEDFGFNIDDVYEVSCYLQSEMLAAGLNHKLLATLQEFLLIPAGASFAWDAIINGTKKVRMLTHRIMDSQRRADDDADLPSSLDDAFDNDENDMKEYADLLLQKSENTGTAYSEMSKLAVQAIKCEQKSVELEETISKLEQKIESYKVEKVTMSVNRAKITSDAQRMSNLTTQLSETETNLDNERVRAKSLEDRVKALEAEMQLQQQTANTEITSLNNKIGEQAQLIEELRRKITELETARPPVTSTETIPESNPTLSPTIDKFEKYRKMRKVLPEAAVRQRMSLDALSQDEIDQFFAETVTSAPSLNVQSINSNDGISDLTPLNDGLDKYRRLRKVLSEASVRQKMVTDGIPAASIEAFFSNGSFSDNRVSSTSKSNDNMFAVVSSPAPVIVPEKFNKYERMKKVLPIAAVRQKMIADGFSVEEVQAYLGEKPPSEIGSTQNSSVRKTGGEKGEELQQLPPEGMSEKVITVKPSVKVKGLFWSKMKPSDVKDTIFYKLADFSLPADLLKEIDNLFAARLPQPAASTVVQEESNSLPGDGKQPAASTRLISVLEPKRIQNILILMGKLRQGPEEVMNLIISLDPDVLTHEVTTTILRVLPSTDELNAVKNFSDPLRLDQASRFCFHLNRIPRLTQRLQCHEIAFSWHNTMATASMQLGILQSACDELHQAHKYMETVFAMILALGNYLNADSKWGKAYGFQLDTVQKLGAMKATKATQGSLLHVLTTLICENLPELLPLSQSWVAITAAAEFSLQQLLADVAQLDQQVTKLNNEFVRIKEGRENEGLDGVVETSKGPTTHPLQKRLDQFLRYAKPKMAHVRAISKSAEVNVAYIMGLFGEKLSLNSGEEGDSCRAFFGVVASFFRSLRVAADENSKRKKLQEKAVREAIDAKAKAERVEAKKRQQGKATDSPASSAPGTPQKQQAQSNNVPKENIFVSFHSTQEASTDAVVADFLNKKHSSVAMRTLSSAYGVVDKKKMLSTSLSRRDYSKVYSNASSASDLKDYSSPSTPRGGRLG